jgi:hypothetical protein
MVEGTVPELRGGDGASFSLQARRPALQLHARSLREVVEEFGDGVEVEVGVGGGEVA